MGVGAVAGHLDDVARRLRSPRHRPARIGRPQSDLGLHAREAEPSRGREGLGTVGGVVSQLLQPVEDGVVADRVEAPVASEQRLGVLGRAELHRAGAVLAHLGAQQLQPMVEVQAVLAEQRPQQRVVVRQQPFEPAPQPLAGHRPLTYRNQRRERRAVAIDVGRVVREGRSVGPRQVQPASESGLNEDVEDHSPGTAGSARDAMWASRSRSGSGAGTSSIW